MKNKLMRFIEMLESNGDYFFSNGSIKKDYEYVTSVLKSQGYWSGTSCRYYFDTNLNLVNIEPRW